MCVCVCVFPGRVLSAVVMVTPAEHHYLAGKHGAEVVTAGCQDDAVRREVSVVHAQRYVTQRVTLPQSIHGVQDGLGMRICHDVFGSHGDSGRGRQGGSRISAGQEGIWERSSQ